jgi:hypothetical protein
MDLHLKIRDSNKSLPIQQIYREDPNKILKESK